MGGMLSNDGQQGTCNYSLETNYIMYMYMYLIFNWGWPMF